MAGHFHKKLAWLFLGALLLWPAILTYLTLVGGDPADHESKRGMHPVAALGWGVGVYMIGLFVVGLLWSAWLIIKK